MGWTVGHSTNGAGTLVARGTTESPVIFTTNDPYEVDPPDPALANPGDWVRIYFTNDATDARFEEHSQYVSGSVLEYVIVEYSGSGGPAITAENCSPYLAHCQVHDNAGKGINVSSSGAGDVKIQDCVVHDNYGIDGSALAVNASGGGGVCIERCQVYDHDNVRGIGVTAGAFPAKIEDCDIARCSNAWHGGGIYLSGGADHIVRGNLVENCTATCDDCKGGGIYINVRTTLDGNVVTNNLVNARDYYTTNVYGGGIYLGHDSNGSMLENNEVTGNTAVAARRGRGGGIYLVLLRYFLGQ
jgi:hypothetical protein